MQRIEGVLNNGQFDRIEAGMSKEDVLRRLGPSGAYWTATYKWSNTLAWTWLYCAYGDFQEYFNVLFDQTTGLVRSTSEHVNATGLGPPIAKRVRQPFQATPNASS